MSLIIPLKATNAYDKKQRWLRGVKKLCGVTDTEVLISGVNDTKKSARFFKLFKIPKNCLRNLEPLHKNVLAHES